MAFDAEHAQQPFEKLAKAIKASHRTPDPEHIHKLRTNARRVEAVLSALELPRKKPSKKLLKTIKSLRQEAGKIRDMDVLTSKAAGISVAEEQDCQILLLEHLGHSRHKEATRLTEQLKGTKSIRRELLALSETVAALMQAGHAEPETRHAESHAAAHALQLSAQLQRYGQLGRRNLHEFRKSGKQLRYVLQMAAGTDQSVVEALTRTQDAIGEWHDWEELLGVAKEVLEHGKDCGFLRELQLHADESYDEAIRSAATLRKRFLQAPQKKGVKSATSSRVMRSTASMTA